MDDVEYSKNFEFGDKFIITPRQIEPTGPSIFDFDIKTLVLMQNHLIMILSVSMR